MKMIALPQRCQLIVIATHQWADKAPREMMMMMGSRLTGSMAGCRLATSSCCVRYSFPSKQVKIDLGKFVCSK